MFSMEHWRTIYGYQGHEFNGKYEVSDWGSVRNVATKEPLAFYSDNRGLGYLRTKMTDVNGKRVAVKIHRLVAYYFLPESDKTEINHKDGNPKNNSWTNLEWCTHKDNMTHWSRLSMPTCKYCGTELERHAYCCEGCFTIFEGGKTEETDDD